MHKLLFIVIHQQQYQNQFGFLTELIFSPKKYRYPMCDNTWLKDALLTMISLEAILSGQKGINQTTYRILMGRGQCNICPVYFLLVSEFMCSIPLS